MQALLPLWKIQDKFADVVGMFLSSPLGWASLSYLLLPWAMPMGLLLHTELCLLECYHADAQERLSSLLGG